jgi:hypothetical protein
MEPKDFFSRPASPLQRQYEALKAFYLDELSAADAATKFGFSPAYFKKLRFEFARGLREGVNPFFPEKRPGPKKRSTAEETVERIITLRKHHYSITDIGRNWPSAPHLGHKRQLRTRVTVGMRIKSFGFFADAVGGEFIPLAAHVKTAQVEHGLCALKAPAHAGPLHAVLHPMPTSTFNHAGGDRVALGRYS